MSSVTPGRAALSVVLIVVSLAGSAQVASGASAKAMLKVVKLKPFTVRGTGFKSGEHVRITLTGGARGSSRGVATRTGAVSVSLPKAAVTTCTAYAVRAVGAEGTKATLKHVITAAACKPAAAVKFAGTSVVITGTHFRPGEKLSVTFVAIETPHTRGAKASSVGAFKVNFGTLPISECSPYKLTIKGSLGSRFGMSQDALPC
jgi:hypothetical protein